MQYRKLTTLRSLGWTRKEMLELFDEMLDIIFEEKNQKMITSKEQIVRETLEELGFSFRNDGTKYLQDIILYYLENRTTKVSLRRGVYLVIEDKWIIGYDELRWSIRYAIQKAFANPTEQAKDNLLFSRRTLKSRSSSLQLWTMSKGYCLRWRKSKFLPLLQL